MFKYIRPIGEQLCIRISRSSINSADDNRDNGFATAIINASLKVLRLHDDSAFKVDSLHFVNAAYLVLL